MTETTTAAAATATTTATSARRRVAIVEDDALLRETLAALLRERADADIVLATGAEAEADRWLGEHYGDWDVAIVDVFIQAGNGIRLLGAHRHRPEGRRIAIFTGFATRQARASCVIFEMCDIDRYSNTPFVLNCELIRI